MRTADLIYRRIGERIREKREQLVPVVSQSALADAVGLSRVSVVNIEKGRQRPPIHLLWSIAEQLRTTLQDLIPMPDELSAYEEPELNEVRRTLSKVAEADPTTGDEVRRFYAQAPDKKKNQQ